jgi:hypothetical protein
MNEFKLNNIPKNKSGFKVPEHYFDDFSSKVMQQLPISEPKVISNFVKTRMVLFAVAAIVVVLLSIPIVSKFNNQYSQLDNATLENYLSNPASISSDDLAELLNEEDIQKMKLDYKIEDKAVEDILSTNSNLEEYIID